MKLVKLEVCEDCLSQSIVDINCVCVTNPHYPTIKLEFEQCECCGVTKEHPADTEFNKKQLGYEDKS